MIPQVYLKTVRGLLDTIEQTQMDAVERSADAVARALSGGGAVFCHGIGHGNEGDWLNRAGGLAALQKFSFSSSVSAPVAECLKKRPRAEEYDAPAAEARHALKAGNVRPGDVMLVSSVSGRNRAPIDLALACRDMKVTVIGLTSLAYTAQVQSAHPSGRKLCDAVDIVVDIQVPYGDAGVDVPGYDCRLIPLSGVSMTVIGWMIWGRVMEKMAAAGTPATVFLSINRAGGQEFYDKSKARYNELGY